MSDGILEELRAFSTPSIANGIETFGVRKRHEGFMDASVRCIFPELGRMVGYAATATMRAAEPGERVAASELWEHVLSVPAPRVVVVQDLDDPPGVGALWGEVNGNTHRALGAAGVVTNGSVRDLDEVRALGDFHFFAGSVGVSHAYVHVVEVGAPVTVGGLVVRPGDIIHGDQHGVISVPASIAGGLPEAIRKLEAEEREVIALCQSGEFSVEAMVGLGRRQAGRREVEGEVRH
ncbi:MAG: RraA family protein [Dehalococcoidia bacterium]